MNGKAPRIPQARPAVRSTKAIPNMPDVPPPPPPGVVPVDLRTPQERADEEIAARKQAAALPLQFEDMLMTALRFGETAAAETMKYDFEAGLRLAGQVKDLRTRYLQHKCGGQS